MSGYNFGPIEDWDVSKVKDMAGLFGVTEEDEWSSSKTYETGDLVNLYSVIYRAVNLSGGTNKIKRQIMTLIEVILNCFGRK